MFDDILVENYFKTGFSRNALIVYVVQPFLDMKAVCENMKNAEAMIMAKLLLEMGYNVDIINTGYTGNLDEGKYDFVIGFGRVFDDLCTRMEEARLKICCQPEEQPQGLRVYAQNLRRKLYHAAAKNGQLQIKIQFLNGGLANQVFQYLFARYYELSHPGQVMYLDDSYFANHTVHNGYELEKVFGLHPHMLSSCFSEEEWTEFIEERKNGKSIPTIFEEHYGRMSMIAETDNQSFNPFEGEIVRLGCNEYDPQIMDVSGNIYYHGYWINKNWFMAYQDIFRKELTFPPIPQGDQNEYYLKKIQNCNSLAIHVRRGDYVTTGHAAAPEVYYQICRIYIDKYSNDWEVFLFSDDVEWCRQHEEELGLRMFAGICYVEGNVHGNNFRDMQLMKECKGMIVSQSAFCYLAALLRENKDYVLNPVEREL
jgi:hypothetical protein